MNLKKKVLAAADKPNCYARNGKPEMVPFIQSQLEGPSLENRHYSGLCCAGFQGHGGPELQECRSKINICGT